MTPPDSEPPDLARPDVFPHWTRDLARYADTDRQGHLNNAVFAVFLESGRVSFLYNPDNPLAPEGASFVIARLVLDFRSEIRWPSEVAIGTAVTRLGRSSMTLGQGIFVEGACVATAETVIVLMDEATRKSRTFPDHTRHELSRLMATPAPAPDPQG